MSFDAFISYSHAADDRLAPALQDGLQRMAKPWNRRRALHIFRDDTGLAVNPALWASIEAALSESSYFILMASPEAAQSEWVNREVTFWKEHKDPEKILPVLTDGEWQWDSSINDFDWTTAKAVPKALGGTFTEEPRHLDLRWARTDEELDLRNTRFREAIADLAAPMHGISKDDLESEDIRQHRRATRLRRIAIGLLVVLTIGFAVAGTLAVLNGRRATEQAQIAEANAAEARANEQQALKNEQEALSQAARADSRALAIQAEALIDSQIDAAFLTAIESYRTDPGLASAQTPISLSNVSPKLQRLIPHEGRLVAIALSSDGRQIAVSNGSEIIVRQAGSHDVLTTIDVLFDHSDILRDISYRPQTDSIVGVGTEFDLYEWDAETGELISSIESRSDPADVSPLASTSMTLTPDGSTAYIGYGSLIEGFDLHKGESLGRQQATTPVDEVPSEVTFILSDNGYTMIERMAVTPDGSLLAIADMAGQVNLWSLEDSRLLSRINTGLSTSGLAISKDSRLLAVASGTGGTVQIWNIDDPTAPGAPVATLDSSVPITTLGIRSLDFSADGKFLAGGSGTEDGRITLWNVTGILGIAPLEEEVHSLIGHRGPVSDLVFDPADSRLYSVGIDDSTLAVWDTSRSYRTASVAYLPLHGLTTDLVFGDERTLVVAVSDTTGESSTFVVLDPRTGQVVSRGQTSGGGTLYDIDLSPNGEYVAGALHDGTVRVWDLASGEKVATLSEHESPVRSVAFRPGSNTLELVSRDETGRVITWEADPWHSVDSRSFFDGFADRSLAYSPAGDVLAVGGAGLSLWDVDQAEVVAQVTVMDLYNAGYVVNTLDDIAFSPDGGQIATTAGASIFIFDTGNPSSFVELTGHDGDVESVDYSPDGRYLASAGSDGRVLLWDTTTGTQVGVPLAPASLFGRRAVAFSDDIRFLAIEHIPGGVAVFRIDVEQVIAQMCRAAGRNLSPQEWIRLVGPDRPLRKTCPEPVAGPAPESFDFGAAAPTPDDYVTLVDDTGFISVAVPPDWVDQRVGPRYTLLEEPIATIFAAPDLMRYAGSYEGSGVSVFVIAGVSDPGDLEVLADLWFAADQQVCSTVDRRPVDHNGLRGVGLYLANCEGRETTIVSYTAWIDESLVGFILQAETLEETDDLERIWNSLEVNS